MSEYRERRHQIVEFFRKSGKAKVTTWLQSTSLDGVVADGVWEVFRSSWEGNGEWRVQYTRPHTNGLVTPPQKGYLDFIPVAAACMVGVLVLDLDGQAYPGPNFPSLP